MGLTHCEQMQTWFKAMHHRAAVSLSKFPPAYDGAPVLHVGPASLCCGSNEVTDVRASQVLVVLISQTLRGLLPGASSTVWALKCQEML